MLSAIRSTRIASQLVARQGRLPGGAALLNRHIVAAAPRLPDGDIITSRRAVERLAPTLRFTIAGVTFEDRQKKVSELVKGQALMLLHDPSNVYDKNAVAVRTMDGGDLGFVPRDYNAQLLDQGISFAKVLSVGQNEAEKWGAVIGTQPGLLSCALQPMPFQTPLLESKLGLESQAYVKALAKSRGSCEVTGITQAYLSKRLEPMPCWRYDYKNRKIELARLAIVCPQVLSCQEHLRRISGPDGDREHDEAVELACRINSWEKLDMEDHLTWFLDMEEKLVQEEWSVSF